jgi:hypothetical protein
MPAPVRITEADLRGAMREPRYWRSGHPERDAFARWVTGGWRALNPADGEVRSAVWVRPYIRDGHPVVGHWCSPPPRHSPRPDEETGRAETETDPVVPANLWRWLRRYAPSDGRGGGRSRRDFYTRDRARRWKDAEGRDRTEDLRRDPETRPGGTLSNDIDQWFRPGGEAE